MTLQGYLTHQNHVKQIDVKQIFHDFCLIPEIIHAI